MRLTHRHGLAVVISLLAAACSDSEPSPASTGPGTDTRLILTLSAETDTIPESTSKRLTARVTDQTGFVQAATVSWRSTDPGIASVSDGLVTGVSRGVASIIASTTGAADTARIVVSENDIVLDVQPSAAVVAIGDTIDFVATVRSRSGDIIQAGNFTWTASDTSAASFVSAGLLRTKREGEISVTAEAMRRQGNSTVKIFKSPVASVTISPNTANVYKGEATTLVVTLRDQNGRLVEGNVTWGSSDFSKAVVDDDGTVTGVGVGTVVITATSELKTGSATINVLSPPTANLSLSLPSSTLMVGGVMQATITATDASGELLTGKTVAYQSGNPSIATVNSSGAVKGIAEGSVTISAIVDGVVARQPIAVKGGKATAISISPSAPIINVGQKTQMTAVVLGEDGSPMLNQVVVWSSSNTSVATISATGLASGVATGTTVITAASGSLSATVTASVTSAPVAQVRVSPGSLTLVDNTQGTVTAEAIDGNGTVLAGRVVTWSSANPTIATVTNSGTVTALSPGSTILTATIEGKTATLPITVTSAPLAPVAAVSVTLDAATLDVGQQVQARAVLRDASGNMLTDRAVLWTSLDTAVAKVSVTGVVTAHAGGTVAIIASSEGKSGSASLTVNT
ncbi:MAG TPA: Ig-like domain-containing protein, partial [Gemmatimonadaceae bacterium]